MSDQPIFDLQDTWNDGATVFNGFKLAITDTASASGSMVVDLLLDGTRFFGVGKDGLTYFLAADFDGAARSRAQAVAALEVDCSLGNYFTKEISANSTFTFVNPPSGVYSMTLKVTTTGDPTITWPVAVKWPNGAPPALVDSRPHLFNFLTDDEGTTWYGSALPNFA